MMPFNTLANMKLAINSII